jgi:hypothetical protein
MGSARTALVITKIEHWVSHRSTSPGLTDAYTSELGYFLYVSQSPLSVSRQVCIAIFIIVGLSKAFVDMGAVEALKDTSPNRT